MFLNYSNSQLSMACLIDYVKLEMGKEGNKERGSGSSPSLARRHRIWSNLNGATLARFLNIYCQPACGFKQFAFRECSLSRDKDGGKGKRMEKSVGLLKNERNNAPSTHRISEIGALGKETKYFISSLIDEEEAWAVNSLSRYFRFEVKRRVVELTAGLNEMAKS